MAMSAYCSYDMASYFAHWLAIGKRLEPTRAPRIFHVNWFRRDEAGRLLWPGFGENIRVLKWIVDRVAGRAQGRMTPIGLVPRADELDVGGLDVASETTRELLHVERDAWAQEAQHAMTSLTRLAGPPPADLRAEHRLLVRRLLLAAAVN
jgi:phosphoenolpyruvate carboxykinase (GTP)